MHTLTQEQHEAIEAFCDDNDLSFRTDYSGRGMYGKTCIGITTDNPGTTLVDLVLYISPLFGDDEDFIEAMRRTAQDSLGHSAILYWPGVSAG